MKNFSNICAWSINDKLSIQIGEDKTKSIQFATKSKTRNTETLDIKYGNINMDNT